MPAFFHQLPSEVNKALVKESVRAIIESMMKNSDMSYMKLSRRIANILYRSIGEMAIRQFMLDTVERKRINSNNITLATLYDFIVVDYHHFPKETLKLYFLLRADLGLMGATLVDDGSLALAAQRWTYASQWDLHRLSEKLNGRFVVLRRSTVSSEFMKSSFTVARKTFDGKFYLEASHVHKDRMGRPRRSRGFALPVVRNIYVTMQVEGHEGMEILTMRDPIQEEPEFFMGFMFGVNSDRAIYASSLLLERLRDDTAKMWDALPHRFSRDDPRLAALGEDFLARLDEVLSETRSRLVPRFDGLQPGRNAIEALALLPAPNGRDAEMPGVC